MSFKRSFTGRSRRRSTRLGVRIADVVARSLITVGGIGTIFAVSLVMVFLVSVVWPLFTPAGTEERPRVESPAEQPMPLHLAIDEYQQMGVAVLPGDRGKVRVFLLEDGRTLEERELFPDGGLTATAFDPTGSHVAFGFADGSVRLGSIGFSTSFRDAQQMPDELQALAVGEARPFENGVAHRISTAQFRLQTLFTQVKDPIKTDTSSAIALLDYVERGTGPSVAILSRDGKLLLEDIRERKNMLTGKVTYSVTHAVLPFKVPDKGLPMRMLLSAVGDKVYLVWEDGELLRFDARDRAQPVIAENIDFVPDTGARVTAVKFLLGRSTLLVGDTLGRVRAWFPVRPEGTAPLTSDGFVMAAGHEFTHAGGAAVTALVTSQRNRVLAAGFADGKVDLWGVTAQKKLASVATESAVPVRRLALSPKSDALVAVNDEALYRWAVDAPHPEVTLKSLFFPVWYEGFPEPVQTWQSVGGTDDFEPKFGLYPLVFGTIKATIYSLLFGVPIALLAAIYTSEFMHPRVRSYVKPGIELMASLPSVVLGFIAGIVLAPIIENVVPAALASLATLPVAFLIGAYVWQLLPYRLTLRAGQWRIVCIALAVPVGALMAYGIGPVMERWFFGGDIKLWLDYVRPPADADPSDPVVAQLLASPYHNAIGGWMFLFLPMSAVAVAFVMSGLVNPMLRPISREWSRQKFAIVDVVKFLLGAALSLLLALAVAAAFNAAGWDPRGSYIDTYVQRNALVVGFVMAFAIIPIIYTISEDALSTVPEHLRSASLGAGATPWQTAVRIIVPVAMSGLFSAVMIGLGRAVGETMIVLMATGNTPVMSFNIFDGFRTLSANIAVELPEAVRGDTHYRTLFLAALTLFVMTFVLNTIAEAVRQRFRKRAYQL